MQQAKKLKKMNLSQHYSRSIYWHKLSHEISIFFKLCNNNSKHLQSVKNILYEIEKQPTSKDVLNIGPKHLATEKNVY